MCLCCTYPWWWCVRVHDQPATQSKPTRGIYSVVTSSWAGVHVPGRAAGRTRALPPHGARRRGSCARGSPCARADGTGGRASPCPWVFRLPLSRTAGDHGDRWRSRPRYYSWCVSGASPRAPRPTHRACVPPDQELHSRRFLPSRRGADRWHERPSVVRWTDSRGGGDRSGEPAGRS
jgi:hypothetical protein